ncbi:MULTISPECIES: carboxylesterase/lipase family protein [Paenibacillus]|uniref:carboxylesterase/lipase family protein n=1 Tax=Paenibacillus TaxID=44249 RepID=UPI001F2F716F|nr:MULTISPECIES: carboxylesterase/lipase family protein [Paenibacillus]
MRHTEASTGYGIVRGTEEDGVIIWRGIPFAAPPVGELRFAAPRPPASWEGVRDASSFGPVSLQPPDTRGTRYRGQQPVFSEDCLYLNVWSPAGVDETLPVMVWIHGGTFLTGSGSQPMFDGRVLASRSRVVVVSVNYRLGPLGFLHLSPLGEGFASNAGLLDQIAALEWVQGNIAAFGGDPKRVTVFGESAGSMSVAALLAMPSARGLFARAIMQSGASQALPPEAGSAIAAALLAELGLDRSSASQLRVLPAESILSAAFAVAQRLTGDSPGMVFQPVVDTDTLPEEPVLAVSGGSASGVPLLIGTNSHEGHYFFREGTPVPPMEKSLKALEQTLGLSDLSALAPYYSEDWEGQAGMMTDLFFWRSAVAFAESYLGHGPVWMYRFDWGVEDHTLLSKAVHTAEIPYVFGNMDFLRGLGIQVTQALQSLSDAMRSAWTAFAYSGSPDCSELPWPEYETEERATLIFDEAPAVVKDPESEKRKMIFE